MGSAFRLLCPRYSRSLTLTSLTAIRLWEILTLTFLHKSEFFTKYEIALEPVGTDFEGIYSGDNARN